MNEMNEFLTQDLNLHERKVKHGVCSGLRLQGKESLGNEEVSIPSSAGHQSRLCWPPESAKERRSCTEDPHPQTEAVTDFPKYKDEMLNGHDNLVSD